MKISSFTFGFILRFSVFPLLGALAAPASAADFTVSTNADSGPGSLRQAITDSNAAGGTNTITLEAGLATITLAGDLPAVQANVTILGNNNTLDGGSTFRGFFVGAWTAGTETMIPARCDYSGPHDSERQSAGWPAATGGGGGGSWAALSLSPISPASHSPTSTFIKTAPPVAAWRQSAARLAASSMGGTSAAAAAGVWEATPADAGGGGVGRWGRRWQ